MWNRVGSELHYPLGGGWRAGKYAKHPGPSGISLPAIIPIPTVKSMVMPAQLETVSPELLRASLDAARERGTPMQVHGAYNIHEFQEITRRPRYHAD